MEESHTIFCRFCKKKLTGDPELDYLEGGFHYTCANEVLGESSFHPSNIKSIDSDIKSLFPNNFAHINQYIDIQVVKRIYLANLNIKSLPYSTFLIY